MLWERESGRSNMPMIARDLLGNDKDNNHLHNGWHTRLICNNPIAKGALSCKTPCAKSVCDGHPI
jgi:hypothetical protein